MIHIILKDLISWLDTCVVGKGSFPVWSSFGRFNVGRFILKFFEQVERFELGFEYTIYSLLMKSKTLESIEHHMLNTAAILAFWY